MSKVIFHIDLNAFFASAELLRNSGLEGQPVVVGGLSKRSVVCTASYEARKYGVRSAMPLFQALTLCPNLIVLKGDHKWYEECSQKFLTYIKKYTPFIEVASIDECFIDVSEIIKKYKRPLDLAWEIQNGLYEELRLPCSIGVAPNKFLAKMASDMRKPMGITVLRKQELRSKLWPLDITEMFGIGKKTVPILKANNIKIIQDIADPKNEVLICSLLGKQGPQAIRNARGQGSDSLVYSTTLQSISQSTTINHDVEDYSEMKNIFHVLTTQLVQRAQKEKIQGKLISISIRYFDFRNVVRSVNLEEATNDYMKVFEQVMYLFDNNAEELPIRHLGVGLGSLVSSKHHMQQLNIFHNETLKKSDILDTLNKNIEGKKLTYASDLINKTNES